MKIISISYVSLLLHNHVAYGQMCKIVGATSIDRSLSKLKINDDGFAKGSCDEVCSVVCSESESYKIKGETCTCIGISQRTGENSVVKFVCGRNAIKSGPNGECECLHGFQGDDPNVLCSDIDECQQEDVCADKGGNTVCENREGSFRCNCEDGYEGDPMNGVECALTSVKVSVILSNETSAGEDGVNTTVLSSATVTQKGQKPVDGKCGKNAILSATGYCECIPGFDGKPRSFCGDVNECAADVDPCADFPYSHCFNTKGSYRCVCEKGYRGEPSSGFPCWRDPSLPLPNDSTTEEKSASKESETDHSNSTGSDESHERSKWSDEFSDSSPTSLKLNSTNKRSSFNSTDDSLDKNETDDSVDKKRSSFSSTKDSLEPNESGNYTDMNITIDSVDSNITSDGEEWNATKSDSWNTTSIEEDVNNTKILRVESYANHSDDTNGTDSEIVNSTSYYPVIANPERGFRRKVTCPAGYSGVNCVDIDECAGKVNPCGDYPNSYCLNTKGSYECRCDEGFKGDPKQGKACTVMCDNPYGSPCGPDNICNDTDTGYECEPLGIIEGCPAGCSPSMECAKIFNEKDSRDEYKCVCRKGYHQTSPYFPCVKD